MITVSVTFFVFRNLSPGRLFSLFSNDFNRSLLSCSDQLDLALSLCIRSVMMVSFFSGLKSLQLRPMYISHVQEIDFVQIHVLERVGPKKVYKITFLQ